MTFKPGSYTDKNGNTIKVIELYQELAKIQYAYGKPWVTMDWLKLRIKCS